MSRFLHAALILLTCCYSFFIYCDHDPYDSSSSCESSDDFYCTNRRHRDTDNVYGPNLRIATTPFRLTDCTIFSAGIEGGSNNIRFTGTFGYFLSPKIHFKCTVEQLNQRVIFNFASGRARQWMRQFATGGVLQYNFCHRWIESVELYGSYAACQSKHLKDHPCCVENTNLLNRIYRHIAGGKDGFAGLGATVKPWYLATFSLAADYDYLTYKRKFSNRINTSGFGGTAKFRQEFECGVSIDLKGEMRRPFNYYEGALNWTNRHPFGILTFGFYTGYTQGRDHLPNNWTTGILVSADFGGMPFFSNYYGCNAPPCTRGCQINACLPVDVELVEWIATPAVRMPTVLAISEEIITPTLEKCPPPPKPHPHPPHPSCEAPNSVTIPTQTSLPIDTSAFFDPKGHPMVFTAENLPGSFFINPATGIIYGNIGFVGTVLVGVTGTTECGHTTEFFEIINQEHPYGPYGPNNFPLIENP